MINSSHKITAIFPHKIQSYIRDGRFFYLMQVKLSPTNFINFHKAEDISPIHN